MNWIKRSIYAVALGLLYLAIFMWFRSHDVWNVSAKVSVGEMYVWTALRLLFVVCLGVACLTAGRIVLMWQTKNLEDFGTLEKMLFYFFVGSAVLRMGMFFIGLQGLYKPIFVFLGSLPLLLLFPFVFDLRKVYRRCIEVVKQNVLESICCGGMCFIAAAILCFVYFVYCQYSFDGDYLTHYGPYYAYVTRSGSLAPNDIWYQFFYSKGAGLFYFSMLITDRVGPLLVSFLHFIATAMLVYAIMKRASGSSLWGILSTIFMLVMMSFPNEGFFIKHHCEFSAIILSITCAVVLMAASKRHRNLCLFVACISQTSLLLYSLQAGAYTLMFIAVYAGISLCRRKYGLMLKYVVILGLTGVVSVLSMLHNYSLTGLYEITPFRIFLKFWNQEIFSKWVSPYLMFYLSEGSSQELGTIVIGNMFIKLSHYVKLFRFDYIPSSQIFWFLFGWVFTLGLWDIFEKELRRWRLARVGRFGISMREREVAPHRQNALGEPATFNIPLSGGGLVAQGIEGQEMLTMRHNLLQFVLLPSFIMCVLVLIVYLLVEQSVSIYRLSEFVSIYVTMFIFSVLIAWSFFIKESLIRRFMSIFVPVALSLVIFYSWSFKNDIIVTLKDPLKFALGRLNANQLAPVNKSLSSQYPLIREVAGKYSRIVLLNGAKVGVFGPLFLENPGIMTEVSYAFGNRWHEIVFGDPDDAKKVLQELGINYFLVNNRTMLFGALPYSPLFTGQSLATNFRIVWQWESCYLFTWNNEKKPMDSGFLYEWKTNLKRGMPSTLKEDADYGKSIYDRVLYLYKLNNHSLQGIVRPNYLEKIEGWQ